MTASTALVALDRIVRQAEKVAWTNTRRSRDTGEQILGAVVSADDLLADVVRHVVTTRGSGCESYPHMDKLLLWSSADGGLRLRLHVFAPGYLDRPHDHRWSFCSRILAGGYVHSLYGSGEDVLARTERGEPLQARYITEESTGSAYFLDSSLVHSLRAERLTASLLLRGPAVKERYFTLRTRTDPSAGAVTAVEGVEWSTGAARESTAQRVTKTMTAEGFERVTRTLAGLGLA